MSRDTNFYYSFLVLPAEKRRAIIAVWDFCRAVDDAVDAPPPDGSPAAGTDLATILAGWRTELDACYGAATPQTHQGRRLQPFVGRFGLPRQAFDDLIDGVAMDVGERRYATFDELYAYCIRVASAVGLITIEIFGYRNLRARDYAINLGVALQLTNIIRDVPADLARGRVYLPLEDLARFGCREDDLRTGRVSTGVGALLKHQCDRARLYYERACATLPPEDARRLVAAEIMREIYFAILSRIERSGYDVFSRIIRVPRPTRAVIAASTWLNVMLAKGHPLTGR